MQTSGTSFASRASEDSTAAVFELGNAGEKALSKIVDLDGRIGDEPVHRVTRMGASQGAELGPF